jgi:hypothetical protein
LPSNLPLVSTASLDGPNSLSSVLILHPKTTISGSDFHPTAKPVTISNTVHLFLVMISKYLQFVSYKARSIKYKQPPAANEN